MKLYTLRLDVWYSTFSTRTAVSDLCSFCQPVCPLHFAVFALHDIRTEARPLELESYFSNCDLFVSHDFYLDIRPCLLLGCQGLSLRTVMLSAGAQTVCSLLDERFRSTGDCILHRHWGSERPSVPRPLSAYGPRCDLHVFLVAGVEYFRLRSQ